MSLESLAVSEELMQATFRDPEGMYYLGRQLAYLRQETQALEILSRVVGKAPETANYRYHYALAWAASGDKGKARSEFERTLRMQMDGVLRDEVLRAMKRL